MSLLELEQRPVFDRDVSIFDLELIPSSHPHPSSGEPCPGTAPGAGRTSMRYNVLSIVIKSSRMASFWPTQLPDPIEKGWKVDCARATSSAVTPVAGSARTHLLRCISQ